jgi:SNF2 family DNA or RNA helicase
MKYRFKTRPYRHQVEGIRFAFKQFSQGLGAALLFEPRTGKTKTTIDIASIAYHKYGVRKVLVIAPNRVLGTWAREFHAHCPLVHEIVVWDAKERRKGAIRQPSGHIDLQVVVTNYETFATPGKQLASGRRSRTSGRFKNRDYISKWIDGDPAIIVCDESHKLKNPSGKASNMVVGLRKWFKYQIILTGTPITKARRAADIYMQWRLINPTRFSEWGATYEDFRLHTGVWTEKNGFPQWLRAREHGLRDLQRGIHLDGLVIRRADCFDLPTTLPDRVVDVPLKASAKHYDEMAEQFVTQLNNGEIAEASIPLVVGLRLSQITSGYVGISKPGPDRPHRTKRDPRDPSKPLMIPTLITTSHHVGNEKIEALREILLDETLEKEEPTIVVARWKHDLDAIQKLCAALKIPHWSIRGGMSRDSTDDALRCFSQHGNQAAVMIVQPQAGGVGLDMRVAGHTIWYSLTPSFVDYTQMRDRNALHPNAVQHTFLLAPGTIDTLLYETLIGDGNFAKAVLKRPTALLRGSSKQR